MIKLLGSGGSIRAYHSEVFSVPGKASFTIVHNLNTLHPSKITVSHESYGHPGGPMEDFYPRYGGGDRGYQITIVDANTVSVWIGETGINASVSVYA